VAELTDILNSGDVNTLVLTENMKLVPVEDPLYEDTFLRVGPGGLLSIYRAPDQDVHWTDTDVTEVGLTGTPNSLLSVIPDQGLDSTDGSYAISGMLDNTSNQTVDVTITVLVNAVEEGSRVISMLREETNKVFVFSGTIVNSVSASDVVTVEFESSKNDVSLRGDLQATKIRLTKAQAAPVGALTTASLNKTFTALVNLNPKPSRSEIESILSNEGYTVPLADDFIFALVDTNGSKWSVRYDLSEDAYWSNKLTESA